MALRSAYVLIFTICAVGLGVAIPAPPPTGNCGPYSERRSCGTACPATCRNPNPTICVLPCVNACFCKQGYLKNAHGECVRPEQCENVPQIPIQIPQANFLAEEPKIEKPKCGADEEYRVCGPSCLPTCENPSPKPWCSLRCFSGCYCKEGYLMEEGKCVHATKCKLPEAMGVGSIPLHRVTLNPQAQASGPIQIPLHRITLEPQAQASGPIQIPLHRITLNPQAQASAPIQIPLHRITLEPQAQASGPIHIPLYKDTTKPEASGPISIPLEKAPFQPHCQNENEEFHTCGVQLDCLASCKPQMTPKCLERKCTPGCVCRQPLVRHEDGRCVEKNQCPKTNPFAQA